MNWFAVAAAAAVAEARPNILWLCADDHAAYVTGAYGNRLVRTPHLDRLAAEGVRFDRAYCNSPVCTASRQSFITGRYPRTIGVTLLKTALPEKEVTLAQMLKDAGYDTAAIGKMHFNSALKHGFDLRLDLADHRAWLRQKGPAPLPDGLRVQPPWKPFEDPASVWLNSACLPFGAVDADMAGAWFAAEAARYLREHTRRPFFLMVSFYEPHSPFHFPIEYRQRRRPDEFVAPKAGPEDDWQIPEVFRPLTEREKQGIIAAYYTATEFLDKNAGLVLDALEQAGLGDNTIVVYTGDNGYSLGQHGRFEKHCAYEPAVRVPLLLRLPAVPRGQLPGPATESKGRLGRARAPRSTPALVEYIDIAPTLLELAGLPVPANVQGKSLVPLLTGKAKTHRKQVFIEYSENEEACLVTERWKFIYCTGKRHRQDGYATGRPLPGRTIQLFDLERDPDELTNLAQRPEQARRVTEFTRLLAEHFKRTARQPELIPPTDDVHALLEHCLQPRDVEPAN